MADALKPVLARQMENYAGFLEHTDHHVGRLIDAIDELGVLDDTLVYVIIGDNGASAEGTLQGTFNELISLNGMAEIETPEFLMERIDQLGGPESSPHYAVGWAHAMCTPYQWTKQVASHWGGTRNGTIVHWPNGIEAKGEIRNQFCHVIDVAPTVLEVAGLPEPIMVNGVAQEPIEGTSMVYSFDDRRRPRASQHPVLRDLRQPRHLPPRLVSSHQAPHPMADHRRRRYRLRRRRVGTVRRLHRLDPGARPRHGTPDKLAELQRLFLIEATRYNVLPLDDRSFERVLPEIAGRPTLVGDKQILRPGMGALLEQHVVNWRNRSWSLTASVTVPDGRGQRRAAQPRRPRRRLGLLPQGRRTDVLLQPVRPGPHVHPRRHVGPGR